MNPAVLTLSAFAGLPPIWPENIAGVSVHGAGDGILIARIHPNCNRASGDEDVLARALVYLREGGTLHRLTIRKSHAEGNKKIYDDEDYSKAYRECLYAIMSLPVVDLSQIPDTPATP